MHYSIGKREVFRMKFNKGFLVKLCAFSILALASTAHADGSWSVGNGFTQACGDSGNDLIDVGIKDCASKYGAKAQLHEDGMTSDLVSVIQINDGKGVKSITLFRRREDNFMAIYPADVGPMLTQKNQTALNERSGCLRKCMATTLKL